MKTRLIFFGLILSISWSLTAQSSKCNKKVLLTLGENEWLFEDEYLVHQQVSGTRFVAITSTEIEENQVFQLYFNGQLIGPVDKVFYTNLNEEKGFAFVFLKDDQFFVNMKGVVHGPYEFAVGFLDSQLQPDFSFRQNGQNFLWNKNNLLGPFSDFVPVSSCETSTVLTNYVCCELEVPRQHLSYKHLGYYEFDDNRRFVFKDKEVGEFLPHTKIYANNEHFAAFNNSDENKEYLQLDDKKIALNPYYAKRVVFTKNGHLYHLLYESELLYNLYKDGVIIEENVTDFDVSYETEQLAFLRNGELFVNGKKSAFKEILGYQCVSVRVNNVGDILCIHQANEQIKTDERYKVFLNNKLIKVADKVKDVGFDSNGKASLYYEQFGKSYMEVNGKPEETFNFLGLWLSDPLTYYFSSKNHSFVNDPYGSNVVIDGEFYGNSPAIKYWFDESKNAFSWTAYEDNQLVLYELVFPQ
jgi:hypothetical protein